MKEYRTPDRQRANADPLDFGEWPHDRQTLIDQLWATALANLPSLPSHEKAASAKASLTGRNLEPWRGILAVAHWLTAIGAYGLWDRLERLSVEYQKERVDLELSDLTSLAIRALCSLVRD